MSDDQEKTFISLIYENLGIAHKVLRIYFHDSEEREDALQEMMYQLWRSYSGFEWRSKFSTWMYRVCLNTALTYKRNNKRIETESLSLRHYQVEDQSAENHDENVATLLLAISELNELNKAIILLHFEKMSYQEIASITGLSSSNVSVRLVRIKKELELKLKLEN